MSDNTIGNLIAEHTLSNGVEIEIREAEGFAKQTQVAFFVRQKYIGSFSVGLKRSSNVEVKPSSMKAVRIKAKGESEDLQEEEDNPTLDDIVSDNDNKTES